MSKFILDLITNTSSCYPNRDEKSTLLSQISTMQGQQAALGSRLESLTQAADNAMEREREADDRLDKALSVHAKQISQRQVGDHTCFEYFLEHKDLNFDFLPGGKRLERPNWNVLFRS